MRKNHKSVPLCCHPEARFWPKDINAKWDLDFAVEILRAENALRMTMGQQV